MNCTAFQNLQVRFFRSQNLVTFGCMVCNDTFYNWTYWMFNLTITI